MNNASTAGQVPRGLLRTVLALLDDRFIDHLLAAHDRRAAERGWTIQRHGKGRLYHDPRWSLVGRCAPCAGTGFLDRRGSLCSSCRGDGVAGPRPGVRPICPDAVERDGVR